MARKPRNNIDYFPHICTPSRELEIIEGKYGNDGYSVWYKLFQALGHAEYHHINLTVDIDAMHLIQDMRVSEGKFHEILNDLAKMKVINKDLYDNHRIIFSQTFIDDIQDAYTRRNFKCITYLGLCDILRINADINNINVDISTQRKVEYSKGKERKVDGGEKKTPRTSAKKIFIAPEFEEFKKFCEENGFGNIAQQAFDYYSKNDWKDRDDNPVKNWKQKLRGVWFKPGNEQKNNVPAGGSQKVSRVDKAMDVTKKGFEIMEQMRNGTSNKG